METSQFDERKYFHVTTYNLQHTVVCTLVGMKSFPRSEETIHSAEMNDTSYESL